MWKLYFALPFLCAMAIPNRGVQLNTNTTVITQQLHDELQLITETYSAENHGFLYSVFKNDTGLVQVIHASYVQELGAKKDEFGLAIHLAFDETFTDEIAFHEKFKASAHFAKFKAYIWDGIPCYAINLKTDYAAAANLLSEILVDIYDFDPSVPCVTEFDDQGEL
jgi:hypothetical protein